MVRYKPVDNAAVILTITHMKKKKYSYGFDDITLGFIQDAVPVIFPIHQFQLDLYKLHEYTTYRCSNIEVR